MGYTTEFQGEFNLDQPLTVEQIAYLKAFNETRRMKRNADLTKDRPDPIREAVGLPVGLDGGFFVGGGGNWGMNKYRESALTDALTFDVVEDNTPPGQTPWNMRTSFEERRKVIDEGVPAGVQPGLWCQWVPNDAGTAIVWDEGEKFYDYIKWLEYIIHHFLKPWGRTLNGTVEFQGEEVGDRGLIVVVDNDIELRAVTYA